MVPIEITNGTKIENILQHDDAFVRFKLDFARDSVNKFKHSSLFSKYVDCRLQTHSHRKATTS